MLHLIRMAAGVEDLAELQGYIDRQIRSDRKLGKVVSIYTRNTPKRAGELLEGGSVYSVIRSVIQCRRKILDIRPAKDSDGKPMCQIVLEPRLIRVMPTAQKPFQGWRYFEAARAPQDLGLFHANEQEPPAEIAEELKALGLL